MPGFYGKLPSHGDFLQRGVNDQFVNRWDAWLQDGIARSRSDLGGAWLDVFLTSPLWRFALASGVVGGPVWAGILLPSVDRVGRYFPLTIVAELPPGVLPFELAVAGNSWFDWAETLARRTLEDELVDLNRLESELRDSDALLAAVRVPEARIELESLAVGDAPCWLALAPDGDMGRFFARVADGLAAAPREPLGLWWSLGSERVAPSVLMTRGLPPASAFRELLCGATQITAASLIDTIVGIPPLELPPPSPIDALIGIAPILPPSSPIDSLIALPLIVPPPLLIDTLLGIPPTALPSVHWQSAAVSHVGRVRDENQDAFVERASEGLWLVADGMGGHQGGKLASQLIAEHVGRIALMGDIAEAARALITAIQGANAGLRSRGQEQPGFDGGSTVVVLYAQGQQGVALWAGDSRLYRLRGGELAQLTRDHSVGEEDGSVGSESHMLTRAVGGDDQLALEELRLDLVAADRYLLCSDGLYSDLTTEEIAARLALPECVAAAEGLVALALERGGTDNATAVVIAMNAAGESTANYPSR